MIFGDPLIDLHPEPETYDTPEELAVRLRRVRGILAFLDSASENTLGRLLYLEDPQPALATAKDCMDCGLPVCYLGKAFLIDRQESEVVTIWEPGIHLMRHHPESAETQAVVGMIFSVHDRLASRPGLGFIRDDSRLERL